MSAGPQTIARKPLPSSTNTLLQNLQEGSSCVTTGRSDPTPEEHLPDTLTAHERNARRAFATTAQMSSSELQTAWTGGNRHSTELVELSLPSPQNAHGAESSIPSGGLNNVPLISIDRSLLSRNIVIGCLVFAWLWSIACIAFGSQELPTKLHPSWYDDYEPSNLQHRTAHGYRLSSWRVMSWEARLIPFVLNVFVTICTDSLGFIQTASLRWSLHREGRLDFNSNLRLLTATKDNLAHRWYINALSALFASVCYAVTPLLSTWGAKKASPYDSGEGPVLWIPQGIHFIYLGLALMGQATLATWCLLLNLRSIPTWSSNPLNTTLACLSINLQRRLGRCMMSVHNSHCPAMVKPPQKQQADASEASQQAVRITHRLWGIVSIALFWGIATAMSVEFVHKYTNSAITVLVLPIRPNVTISRKFFFYLWYGHGLNFSLDPPVFPEMGINAANTLRLLSMMLVQGILVFGLHCLEILVNMSRDEDVWRLAISDKGVRHEYNAIMAALSSPQTLMLFGGKAAAHWAIGQSFSVHSGDVIFIRTAPIFVLTAIMAGLAYFGTYLATQKPKGPLPATFGHIQTLADLIDKWSAPMYWGDMGTVPGTELRHAGTSPRPLKPPQSGSQYGGACCDAVCDAYNRL
jgi:hypothetical protein